MAHESPIARHITQIYPSTRSNSSKSPLQSQGSSFNDSTASQVSNAHAGYFESSQTQLSHPASTPATSPSNTSSQERMKAHTTEDNDDLGSNASMGVNLWGSHARYASTDSPSRFNSPTSVPKRMANGEVKSPTQLSPIGPHQTSPCAHSRTISDASRKSDIGEKASQLHTRLAFAAFKVNNGLEHHKFSEVEAMASPHRPPVSAGSDRPRQYRRSSSDDSYIALSSSQTPRTTHAQPTPSPSQATLSPQRPAQQITSQPSNPSSQATTYESFWRNNSTTNTSNPSSQHALSIPSLAPPADILSRPTTHTQRPQTNKAPPPLRTTSLQPTTPQRHLPTTNRTPSQQLASEKDAVETLLFMSSPGNSGYSRAGPLAGQSSPLRSAARTPISAKHRPELEASRGVASPRKGPLTERELDRMIEDEMREGESSEEEEEGEGAVLGTPHGSRGGGRVSKGVRT